MAGGNHEAVDGCHGPLVLAERQLNRRGTLGIVALAREWDRLILGHMARFFDRCAPLVVSLERLLILLSPIEACSAIRRHALLVPESSRSQPGACPQVFAEAVGAPSARPRRLYAAAVLPVVWRICQQGFSELGVSTILG